MMDNTHDSGVNGQEWVYVTWKASNPSDLMLIVQATLPPRQPVMKAMDLIVPDERYLQV